MLYLTFLPVSCPSQGWQVWHPMRYARSLFRNLFNQSVFRSTLPAKKLLSESRVFWKSGQIQIQGLIKYFCSQFPRPQQSPLRMLSLSANFCRRSHRWQCSHSTESLAVLSLAALLSLAVAVLGLETLRGGSRSILI